METQTSPVETVEPETAPVSAPPPAPPAPPAAVAPAKPFFTPPVIVALLVVLIAAVLATLYFTGVFDGSPRQPAERTTIQGSASPGGTDKPTGAGTGGDLAQPGLGAGGDSSLPLCQDVVSEQAALALPDDDRQRNDLTVSAGGDYLWNGAPVDAVRLRQYLDLTSTMAPTPLLVVSVAPGAPPAAVASLGEAIARSLSCRFQPS